MKNILRTAVAKVFLFLICVSAFVYAEWNLYAYGFVSGKFSFPINTQIGYITCLSVAVGIITLIIILCVAAKRPKNEEPVPGLSYYMPTDIFVLFMVIIGIAAGFFLDDYLCWNLPLPTVVFIAFCFYTAFSVAILMDLGGRVRAKGFFKNTVIFMILKLMYLAGKAIIKFCRIIPYVWRIVLLVTVIVTLDIIAGVICLYSDAEAYFAYGLVERIILVPVIFYSAWCFKKLKDTAHNMAEGDFTRGVDGRSMLWGYREHATDLNKLMTGMNMAVMEKTKSERMKTELITNVSHDIKTPLTSIINYADLIKTEAESDNADNSKITEYGEVIYRQSDKLKRLLEDLIEVSKASSGNIETNPVECEADILLNQAAGEYEDRFAAANLTPIVSLPEKPMVIMADRTHLWRIFDNLLGNICKYSLPGSRVFLEAHEENNKAVISFKNTSRELISVNADDLKERFVRGDSSRNSGTEGHGLGLAIAMSLTELQNGKLDISVNADLFTAILTFPIKAEQQD